MAYYPAVGATDSDFLSGLLQNHAILEEIANNLRCHYYDADARTWTKRPGSTPLVNEQGIATVLSLIAAVGYSKVLLMSNLDERTLCVLGEDIEFTILDALVEHARLWEIDRRMVPIIRRIVCNPIHYALRSVKNNEMRKFMRSVEQRVHHTQETIEPERSWFGGSKRSV